jgi:hypothetical protein
MRSIGIGRLTDMFPLIPGSFTFIREVASAAAQSSLMH